MQERFIADAMLGRLSRWLRFLGFDTLYYRDIKDSKLIRIARQEDRCILTRDTHLVKIKGVTNYLLIKANDSINQLLEVLDTLKLNSFNPCSRCVACNGILEIITNKEDVKNSVPDYVFINNNVFMKCIECGKIYWEGTHPKKFRETLFQIMQKDY